MRQPYNQSCLHPFYDDPRREKWDAMNRAGRNAERDGVEWYVYQPYKEAYHVVTKEEPNLKEYYVATPDCKFWSVERE